MRDDRYYYNVITGIDKGKSDDERIAVYPNPSGDIFHFRIGNFTDKNQMLFIYDMAGRVIFTAKFKENSSLWDASKNAPGIYFYKIISGNDSQSGKMILSR